MRDVDAAGGEEKIIIMDQRSLDDIKHEVIPYNPRWAELFETEKQKLRFVFNDNVVEIEHIGSTAIPNLASKPIIDIAVLFPSQKDADKYIEPLSSLGYEYDQPASSSERHFFRKYGSTKYHLSIAYRDKGTFWERQILFRDYLRAHEKEKKEYETLKLKLIQADPTGRHSYIQGKNEFVEKILKLARSEN